VQRDDAPACHLNRPLPYRNSTRSLMFFGTQTDPPVGSTDQRRVRAIFHALGTAVRPQADPGSHDSDRVRRSPSPEAREQSRSRTRALSAWPRSWKGDVAPRFSPVSSLCQWASAWRRAGLAAHCSAQRHAGLNPGNRCDGGEVPDRRHRRAQVSSRPSA